MEHIWSLFILIPLKEKLGLPSFPLLEPEDVDITISSSQLTKKTLSCFVKFKATSLDGLWTSHTVIVTIAPGLCMPIISLPFLKFNNIVSDHSLCACIHKQTSYNLINPVIPPFKPAPRPKLKTQLRENCHLKAEALKELINTFDTKWRSRLCPHKTVKPFDKLKAVKMQICMVINDEIHHRKEEQLMEHFENVFEPIPHYNKLPTEIEAEIKLIDPNKIIKTHNYPCPRKYKDVWQTLIQQPNYLTFIFTVHFPCLHNS